MPPGALEQTVEIPAGQVSLEAGLAVPEAAVGVVAFAHGSGSSRHSPRNRYVARELQDAGLATVLVDLLTPDEDHADHRFDIALLSERVAAVTDWAGGYEPLQGLALGLFGASTGAAAALVAAASRPEAVSAVVSRGGRPDLAGDALASVHQPTLLIVGGRDEVVIELNRRAMQAMPGDVRLEIVAGATHLFEEPGALPEVANRASEWFVRYLAVAGRNG